MKHYLLPQPGILYHRWFKATTGAVCEWQVLPSLGGAKPGPSNLGLADQFPRHLALFAFANHFTCVNGPSARIVQLAEKRVKTVRSVDQFQKTCLTVYELNLPATGIKMDR